MTKITTTLSILALFSIASIEAGDDKTKAKTNQKTDWEVELILEQFFEDSASSRDDEPTPGQGRPAPYPNFSFGNGGGGNKTVVVDGEPPASGDPDYSHSIGDKAPSPGTGGGTPGTSFDKIDYHLWTMDVKYEGKSVVRMSDILMFHNGDCIPISNNGGDENPANGDEK